MDIPLVKVGLPERDALMPALEQIIYSGVIAEGEAVYSFEEEFKSMFEIENGVSMSSGTAALHASLVLSGVCANDEVISTSMTAEPTNISILQSGAVPVFADVDPLSGNISASSIRDRISSRTKAIVVVHYAGIPVNMGSIMDISREFGIPVIEDCAHALGAKYDGKAIGTIGDFGIFSFQAIKHMTTIDGGFLAIKDKSKNRAAKKFRWFGLEKGIDRTKIDITEVGYKYNMHNVAATVGLQQLKSIESRIQSHVNNGIYFDSEISKISGLSVVSFESVAKPSYWLYTVLSDDSDDIQRKLSNISVASSKLHRPNHLHSVFSKFQVSLPNLDEYYRKMIHIPCGWWVDHEIRENIVSQLQRG
ncbi:MAG: DegT/DnrJ/EryC1/StrS family aminotransferase [Glaciecola sp.]|jgi:dTDP-4-amino-4,6-dideoxygalactose transaminase